MPVLVSPATLKMKLVVLLVITLVGLVASQGREEIPPELRCFLKGFFKCRSGLQSICAEFKGNNRRAVPLPKRRFNGQCPILGQTIPNVNLDSVDLPPCPCVDGNQVISRLLNLSSYDSSSSCLGRFGGCLFHMP